MTKNGQAYETPMLKRQYFGAEIECTGITREEAARALGELFDSTPYHEGGSYDAWSITDPQQKKWKLVSDGSISGEMRVGQAYHSTDARDYKVEMVTPKLEYAEMEKFQEAIRTLRSAGAKVNSSCGMHVHVDGANHNEKTLKNLLSIMYSKEDLLFKALQVPTDRSQRWCQPVREGMLDNVRKKQGLTIEKLERIWYNTEYTSSHRRDHYDYLHWQPAKLPRPSHPSAESEQPSAESEQLGDELPADDAPAPEPTQLDDPYALPATMDFEMPVMLASVGSWTEYGRQGHASASGDNVSFSGHPQVPFTSLLFMPANDGDYRVLTFHLTEGNSDWHTLEGTGFVFNAGMTNGLLSGYAVLFSQTKVTYYKLNNVSVRRQ